MMNNFEKADMPEKDIENSADSNSENMSERVEAADRPLFESFKDKGNDIKDVGVYDETEKAKKGLSEEVEEKNTPIENKIEGSRREEEVSRELEEKYPENEGYTVESEVYLRDEEGKIVKDPVTEEARRVDFIVVKDGEAVDSIEVTSKTADKTEQSAKEARIRENGGNYIKDSNGNLVRISDDIQTRIERRD